MTSPGRPRVLHVLEATLGGTRRYLEDIIAADASFDMSLAYALARADISFPATLERARSKGWPTWHVPMVRRIDPAVDVRCVLQIARLIRIWRPHIVHAHSSKAGGIARLALPASLGRPRIVYSPHAIASDLGTNYMRIERLLAPLTARFVAVSESERRQLAALRLRAPERIDVVPPTIDVEYWAPRPRAAARIGLGIAEDVPLLVGIGRLGAQKNPLDFVRVAARLRETNSRLQALWLGDGEMRGEMQAAIAAAGASQWLRLAGWIADVRDHIAAADIVLSVSRYESFGYVVAEAVAMDRSVVASRVTGVEDILASESSALLYPAGNVPAAAALADRILSDAAFASEKRRFARQDVLARFDARAMRRALERTYSRALA